MTHGGAGIPTGSPAEVGAIVTAAPAKRDAHRATPAALVALGVLITLAAVLVLDKTASLGFYNDEWDTILRRPTPSADSLLRATNGHLSGVQTLVYQALIHTFGIGSYLPFRIALVAAQALFGVMTFFYLRGRIGQLGALIATAFLLFLGAAWEDMLSPFQLVYYIPLISTAAVLLLVDRETRRCDIAAAVCMLVGVGASGVGLPIAVGLAVELSMRRKFRRLWVPVVPLALWCIWFIAYGDASSQRGGQLDQISDVPDFVARMAGAGAGALVGTGDGVGRFVALLVVASAIAVMVKHKTWPPRLVNVCVMPFVFWLSVAWTRPLLDGVAATFGRYILPSAFFVILILAETLAVAHLGRRTTGALAVGALILGLYVVPWNLDRLDRGQVQLQLTWNHVRSKLSALELVRDSVRDRDYVVQRRYYFTGFTAGEYFDAVDELGSRPNLLSAEELNRAPRLNQVAANEVILDFVSPILTPTSFPYRAGHPMMTGKGVRFDEDGECTTVVSRRPLGFAAAQGHELSMWLASQRQSYALVGLAAFGDETAAVPVASVEGGEPVHFEAPAVPTIPSWTVKLQPLTSLEVCDELSPSDESGT